MRVMAGFIRGVQSDQIRAPGAAGCSSMSASHIYKTLTWEQHACGHELCPMTTQAEERLTSSIINIMS